MTPVAFKTTSSASTTKTFIRLLSRHERNDISIYEKLGFLDFAHLACIVSLRRSTVTSVRVNCCKILVPYRQVRRRRVAGWTRLCPAGALAIGGFVRSRWRGGRGGELWVLHARFEIVSLQGWVGRTGKRCRRECS